MKKISVFLFLVLISFYSFAVPSTVDLTSDFKPSGELEGCKVIRISNGAILTTFLYVVKCPNSKTSVTHSTKHPTYTSYEEEILSNEKYPALKNKNSIVVNGVKYFKVPDVDSKEKITINGQVYYKE